ncbi:hypothetical protein HFO39_23645 [Rhizobium leguminosarum]|uniref:hypothetical protein n=1 Tax=Rhizobium leguminosarum TaxID=384 RepID=UPI001C975A34|nr:hypothetical protein [Rhizobium leguminosarum]MBY5637725.1 hypothetical protein [Rhizobium leguminosarum]
MKKRPRNSIGVLFVSIGLLPSLAEAGDLNLKIYTTGTTAADSLWLNSSFSARALAEKLDINPIMTTIKTDDAETQPENVFVKWGDNRTGETGIPLFAIAAFEGKEISLSFNKIEISKENVQGLVNSNCNGASASSIPEAFKTLQICRAAVKWLAENDSPKTTIYKRAFNGWFVSNYFLYTRTSNTVKFSPFGLQNDLVSFLKDITGAIDSGTNIAADFAPLRIEDVRQALKDKNSEGIRMAAVIPQLVKNGQFLEAKDVNDNALRTYERLSPASSKNVIHGVTGDLLRKNSAFIKTMLPNDP